MTQHETFVLLDVRTGQRFHVPPKGLRIGRTSQNDVVLRDDQVSRNHTTLWPQGNRLIIRDENSTNGIWVNGERISARRTLQKGDKVRIGDKLFQVATGAPSAMARPPAGSSLPLVPIAIAGGVVIVILIGLAWGNQRGLAVIPTRTPSTVSTLRPVVSAIPEQRATPGATATLSRTATPTHRTRPSPQVQRPELIAPEQGREYDNPITFRWSGVLSGGQTYQVTAYHPESDYQIQSGLVLDQTWSADLPAEQFGEWRWKVTVVDGGEPVATSDEWMFWFQPFPGSDGPKDTPTPEESA